VVPGALGKFVVRIPDQYIGALGEICGARDHHGRPRRARSSLRGQGGSGPIAGAEGVTIGIAAGEDGTSSDEPTI